MLKKTRVRIPQIKKIGLALALSSTIYNAQAANLLEVYNHAVHADPVSIAAKLQVLISEEQQALSHSKLLPQVSASGSFSQNSQHREAQGRQSYSGKSLRLNVDQALLDVRSYRDNEKYKALIDKSTFEYQKAQAELMERVVELYFNVLSSQDAFELSKKNTESIGKSLDQVKALFERQLAPVTGVYEAEARHDLAKSAEIEAQAAMEVAYERLYEVIAERVPSLGRLKEGLSFENPEKSIDDWLALAWDKNPAIAAEDKNIAASKKELSVKQAAYYPRISIGLSQSHQDIGYDNSPSTRTDTSSISLNFSQPIYQGGGISAQRRESMHRVDLAEQRRVETKRRVEQQVREHYLNLKSDVLKIRATKRSIESEKKRKESVSEGFKYGTVTINDVLNAETDYLRAQLEHQNAKYKYLINQVKLKAATGTIDEKDILDLNRWLTEE